MRLLVYTDSIYARDADGTISDERAFSVFVDALARSADVVVVGRLRPQPGRSHYVLTAVREFVALPYYDAIPDPAALPAMARSLRVFWRALDRADAVWLLGPTPLTIAFALLGWARGRRVVLGCRQDFPRYVRSRYPGRRALHLAADALEAAHRALARRHAVVVVGEEVARRYGAARRRLELPVSLVQAQDVVDAEAAAARRYDGVVRILSVGRLETEKNPLLLADVLAQLRATDPRYELVVCGEGALERALRDRLAELGLAEHARLAGFVGLHEGLLDLYRSCQVLLHVSWTEAVPQVLFEAFASGLPVVATDVGSVAAVAAGRAILIPPGDAAAAAAAVRRVVADAAERQRLVTAGLALARERTIEAQQRRLLAFLAGG